MEFKKAKYIRIDIENKVIYTLDEAPASNGLETILEDASMVIVDGVLTISGYKWMWNFDFESKWLDELTEEPRQQHLKFKYKTIKDFFNSTKHPYVKYWWRNEKSKLVDYVFNQWAIV